MANETNYELVVACEKEDKIISEVVLNSCTNQYKLIKQLLSVCKALDLAEPTPVSDYASGEKKERVMCACTYSSKLNGYVYYFVRKEKKSED